MLDVSPLTLYPIKTMKSINRSLFSLFLLTFAFTYTSNAQQSTSMLTDASPILDVTEFMDNDDELFPAVNNYLITPATERDASWWGEVESQISIADVNYKKVTAQHIRHILHFEVNYDDQVNLNSSASTLLDVYMFHKSEPMRIMAMAALVEIGDVDTIKQAHEMLYRQRSERVVDYSILALQAFYNG